MKNHPNSLKTYFNTENKRRWKSHTAIILRCLKMNGESTNRQISKLTGMEYHAVAKRTTDKKNSHLFRSVRTVYEDNSPNPVSVYDINYSPELPFKKQSFTDWAKLNYPEVYEEFKNLNK